MTTIVAHREQGLMVADSRVSHGEVGFRTSRKIARVGAFVVGVAGAYGPALAYRRALAAEVRGKSPCTPPQLPSMGDDGIELMVLGRRGLWIYGEGGTPIEVEEPAYAVGSGAGWALASLKTQAALGAGQDIELALRVACELDSQSTLPMVELRLSKSREA